MYKMCTSLLLLQFRKLDLKKFPILICSKIYIDLATILSYSLSERNKAKFLINIVRGLRYTTLHLNVRFFFRLYSDKFITFHKIIDNGAQRESILNTHLRISRMQTACIFPCKSRKSLAAQSSRGPE